MSIMEPSPAAVPVKNLRKSVVAGAIGVLVHWFDWAVYAYMATTMAKVFFPEGDETAALLAVFGVFAVSFLVRPLGAFLFGEVGDRFGRKITLSLVILMMAASTLIIGLLPGYAVIGIWAPILLLCVRIVQGLAAGGEFGSAATFLAEYSPRRHRAFGVSWLEVGSLLGFLLASLAVFILSTSMSTESFESWGWRIPFLIAAPMGVIGFYIRKHIDDTPEFTVMKQNDEKAERKQTSPTKELMRRNWKQLFQMIGIQIMQQVTFYVVLVYLLTYQETELGITAANAAVISALASIVGVILVPMVGALADRIGRRPVLILTAVLTIALPIPAFLLMGTSVAGAAIATMMLGAVLALQLGVHAVVSAELFPTRTRQTGLSIGYSLVSAVFSGTVPYLMIFFIAKTGNIHVPAYYLIIVGAIGLIATLTLRETKGVDLLAQDDLPEDALQEPHTPAAGHPAHAERDKQLQPLTSSPEAP